MATVNLATDGFFVSGDTNVNELIPVIVTGTTANTYVLPGDISVPPGATFTGYTTGTRFQIINKSNQTQTISAPTGYTILGPTTVADGSTNPTKFTLVYAGGKQWLSV